MFLNTQSLLINEIDDLQSFKKNWNDFGLMYDIAYQLQHWFKVNFKTT